VDDLRTVWRVIARRKAMLLAAVLIASATGFLATGEKLEFVSVSPDRTYRLEYYTPRRYQRLVHWKMGEPAFVRLYRNIDNAYFGESIVADFIGGTGDPIWLIDKTGEVAIGGAILYQDIPPVTAGGEVLPVPSPKIPASSDE
jgi:hypothetical protein